ncbi:hypothetical protein [Pseudopedobacter beijingensis]|uniref:Uncharacterized protein n=1 Tax=Pseudopedobacter beijingensis TaxID=1207056 RepID=A0ABW4ID30_9SPHI
MSLTNIKITPLSLVLAVCVAYVGYLVLFPADVAAVASPYVKVAYTLVLAFVLFLTDIIFRRLVTSMKWIWLIQSSFILLIIILILIFKKI